MSPSRLPALLALSAVAVSPFVVTTLKSPNQEFGGGFGGSVAGAGDVDGDGYPDLIVGADGEHNLAGQAYVFSGRTAGLLFPLISPNSEGLGSFGAAVAGAGDVDQDGLADVAVGAPREPAGTSGGRAYVFGGREGRLILSLVSPDTGPGGFFGWSVAAAGDVDRDGHADVVVGDNLDERAYVFGGRDGALLLELAAPRQQHFAFFGHSVAGAGDLDGDGTPDLVVAAPQQHLGGRVYVFGGADGRLLLDLRSPHAEANGSFGSSVAGPGDLDGDGTPDLAVGASLESVGQAPRAGRAYAFSGRDGRLLFELTPSRASGNFGASVSGMGDLNGDGFAEIVVGALAPNHEPSAGDGRAFVFSGRDGRVLRELAPPRRTGVYGSFGGAVAGAGDVDQDGLPDVLVGARGEGAEERSGRAHLFSRLN